MLTDPFQPTLCLYRAPVAKSTLTSHPSAQACQPWLLAGVGRFVPYFQPNFRHSSFVKNLRDTALYLMSLYSRMSGYTLTILQTIVQKGRPNIESKLSNALLFTPKLFVLKSKCINIFQFDPIYFQSLIASTDSNKPAPNLPIPLSPHPPTPLLPQASRYPASYYTRGSKYPRPSWRRL